MEDFSVAQPAVIAIDTATFKLQNHVSMEDISRHSIIGKPEDVARVDAPTMAFVDA